MANIREASLFINNLKGFNLKRASNLTIEQLSKMQTLYNIKLDKELFISLKKEYPAFLKNFNYFIFKTI